MKKFVGIILFLSQLVFAANTGIIPTPQKVEFGPQKYQLGKQLEFEIRGNPQNLQRAKESLRDFLGDLEEKKGTPTKVLLEKKDDFHIEGISPEQLLEAYSLEISSKKITILSGTDKGLFYGLMSLLQLIRANDAAEIPTLKILDYPDMLWRGISDDFSRGQVSNMENFESILRFLAEYKQNFYMPYMEDLVQLQQYPDIGHERGALSQEEIAELQRFAKEYFIEVIPIFQTLGHYENILSNPNYIQFAEYPGAASLNSIDSSSRHFLFSMLDEIIPQFSSEYFHIGCDESWDVGLGATKDLVKKIGTAAVHANHYNRVYNKVTSYGKKVLMYGDIILRHPEILQMIPKDITIINWQYRPSENYPSIKQFKNAGFPFLVSPGIHNWRQNIPNFNNAWLNISRINYEGYLQGALGSVNSSWGDYGGVNFREMNYLGYAFGAESSWNPSDMDGETIRSRFFKQYFGSDDILLESLFLVANQIPDNTDLRNIFGNPFVPDNAKRRDRMLSSTRLIQSGELCLQLIEELRQKDMRNLDKLDYFEVGARFGILTGRKSALKQKLDFYTQNVNRYQVAESIRVEWIEECKSLISESKALEKRYRELWLRTNRPENLDRLMSLLQQQALYLEKVQESLENGIYDINQGIPSKWIAAKAFKKGRDVETAYLRKQFEIEDPAAIESAFLQLVANDAAEIYLNGERVGFVAAAKSGSLLSVKRQVAYWDVRELLQEGKNTLAVKVQAYRFGQSSSANIYFEYKTAKGKSIICSDASWQASTSQKDGWQSADYKKGKWKNALILQEHPRRLTMPLFDEGFPSLLEL